MWLFACTVFLSAALMFLLEPMVARLVLPIAGGGPMVWNTCVVFFQAALLAGYGYARQVATEPDVKRLSIHSVALVLPLLLLPPLIAGAPAPGANPAPWLLFTLTTTIGLPFVVLATTATLFQSWLAETRTVWARNPYVLYSLSNAGSLVALLAYPLLVEPAVGLHAQFQLWTFGYGLFVLLALTTIGLVWRHTGTTSSPPVRIDRAHTSASWSERGWWTLLAFVPSSLMLGVTTYLVTDVASVPLLWIVPLALYLLTFVVAFTRSGDSFRAVAADALPLFVLPLIIALISRSPMPFLLAVALHLATFTIVAMNCHGELAGARPAVERLPDFYLCLALGGVLGGIFNTLIAPLLFSQITEYPLVLTLSCALIRPAAKSARWRLSIRDVAVVFGSGVFTAALIDGAARVGLTPRTVMAGLCGVAIVAVAQRSRPLRFALSVAVIFLAATAVLTVRSQSLDRERTFFGVYRVERSGAYHEMLHGTTIHGMQAVDSGRQSEPLTYYARMGPFGLAFDALPALGPMSRIAVVGLGAGTLAAYAHDRQQWTFFEIDPAVERIARDPRLFTYLSRCGSRCAVVIGDARQSLTFETTDKYDLLVLDAFSSDAIPLHLLTQEALQLYLSRLTPGGALAFHISNRHLVLAPILARLARSEHLTARDRDDAGAADARRESPSEWIVMARAEADLGAIAHDSRWIAPTEGASAPLWTDDFTNVWSILRD